MSSSTLADRTRAPGASLTTRARNRVFQLTPLAAAIAAGLGSPLHAQAQAQGADKGKVIEEIVVTATKRELDLQNVAQSITAFSQDTIEKMAFKSMDDYMKALPSASLTNSMPGRNNVSMRGISTGNSVYRIDSQVAVYLDEQPITSISQQPEVHIVDIERIESLPGPQGTLFGSSAQAGTLRIITNKPNFEGLSGQVDGTVSTTKDGDPGGELSGHINIPIIPDKLALRVVGFDEHDGGYVDNVVGPTISGLPGAHGSPADNSAVAEDDQNEYDIGGGRIAVLWNVTENWAVDLSYIRQDSQANGTWESDPHLGSYKVTRFFDEYRNDDWWQVAGTVRGDLGFAQLVATTAYFDRESSYEWDNMAYNQWQTSYYAIHAGNPLYDFEYEFGSVFNFQWQDRVSQEIRLTSQGQSKLDWMIGGFFEEVHDKWDYGAWIPHYRATNAWQSANDYSCYYESHGRKANCPLAPTTKIYDQHYDKIIDQYAAFGELTWHFTPKLSGTMGIRWFEFDRQDSLRYELPAGKPPAGSWDDGRGHYSSEGDDSDTSLKFGVQYQIDDDRMVYALYSEGYRLGGENSPRAAATGSVPQAYDPDTLENYEAGIKSEWFDNSLQFNASLFLMEWDNIQFNARVDGPFWLRGTFNADTGESKGVELSALWRATDNLTIDGSAFLADAEFTGDALTPRGGVLVEDGTEMPNGPETKYRVGVEYTLAHPAGLEGEVRMRYDTTYTGKFWDNLDDIVDDNPQGRIPESWYTTAQIGYDSGGAWSLTLVGRNLWDDEGISNIIRTTYKSNWFHDERFRNERTLYRPRTFDLSLRVKF